MEMYSTTVYVIADEVLRILNLKDDSQSKCPMQKLSLLPSVRQSSFQEASEWEDICSKNLDCF